MVILLFVLSAIVVHGQTLAIRNVTVVDAGGARPKCNVVIERGRIVAAAPAAKIPTGARTIEGNGRFLIPGLWDMHVHLWDKDPMAGLYVAAGVLGVRDMGSDLKRTRQLRQDIAAGRTAGPLIYTSGPPVDGPGAGVTRTPVIKAIAPADGDRAAEDLYMSSVDFVTVTSSLPAEAYQALAYRTRVRRIPFAGPLPEEVSVDDAIRARQRSIEHLFGIAMGCSLEDSWLRRQRLDALARKDDTKLREIRTRTFAAFNPAIASQVFRQMARYGVWLTPTLTLRKRMSLIDLEELASKSELRYVPSAVRSGWQDPREALKNVPGDVLTSYREDYEFHRKLIPYIRQAGTGILAGTDTGDPFVVPGFALHDELASLVEAGLSPAEALATATIQPARYFNLEATHGTVERGKVANLVLLAANPLDDINNTRSIVAVVNQGKLIARPCLDALLEGKPATCASVAQAPEPPPSSPKPAKSRKRRPRSR